MATSPSCIKGLKRTCEIVFAVSGGWNSATCTWNKQFLRGALKRGVLKNLSKFTDKHKHSSGGGLSKDVLKNF